jgi:hypothetical protein
LLQAMCDAGQEGVIAKKAEAPYRSDAQQMLAEDQVHAAGRNSS